MANTPRRGKRRKIANDLDDLVNSVSKATTNQELPSKSCIPAALLALPHTDPSMVSAELETVAGRVTQSADTIHQPPPTPMLDKLGFNGLLLLRQCARHVPEGFMSRRPKYIHDIVQSTLSQQISLADISVYLSCLSQEEISLAGSPSLDILWNATFSKCFPYTLFLSPPVTECLSCFRNLQMNHEPTVVICHSLTGPMPAAKITLRCRECSLNYRYDQYGNSNQGYHYYRDHVRPYVRASNCCFVSRECCALWAAASHHSWTSFQASAEIYNEFHRSTLNKNQTRTREYLKHCQTLDDETENEDTECVDQSELHRKMVAQSFWNCEVEEELREEQWTDYAFHSPDDREKLMERVDLKRATTTYDHQNCSDECRKRGCGTLFSIDGNWKLRYPICMYTSPKTVSGFQGNLKYVSSCPCEPIPGKAFCQDHASLLESEGIPTNLREFLNYSGIRSTSDVNSEVPTSDIAKVNDAASTLPHQDMKSSSADCQGTSTFLAEQRRLSEAVDKTGEVLRTKTTCNKDTGEKRSLQKWSRGIWMCVSGGGIIQSWQPLYQSEGPAQVFLLVLTWLTSAFGHRPREEWKDIIVSYDNMCHLNNLKVAKKPLPLPGNLKYIWLDIQKIIDSLHIRNHRDPSCKDLYSPQEVKEKNPSYNTMCCEQTFVWLSRFKRTLCAMQKTHHHFFLHRMVKRRNRYIEYCYKMKRRPLFPKSKQ